MVIIIYINIINIYREIKIVYNYILYRIIQETNLIKQLKHGLDRFANNNLLQN